MQFIAVRFSIPYHRSDMPLRSSLHLQPTVSTFLGTVKVKIKAKRSHSLQLVSGGLVEAGQGRAGRHRSRKDTLKDTYNWFGEGSTQKDT